MLTVYGIKQCDTCRQLSEAQRQSEGVAMLQLLLQFPTLIKRPVFFKDQVIAVGFNPKVLADL